MEPRPPIKSELPEIQAEFEEAMSFLEGGEWDQAVEALRFLQSQYAGDPTAALAELFIARGLLGDLEAAFSLEEAEVDEEVFRLLVPLSQEEAIDERVRFAAMIYLGLAYSIQGNLAAGLGALSSYPGASLSPVVLRRDRSYAWPLVAEALTYDERYARALQAWARYLDELIQDEEGYVELSGVQDAEERPQFVKARRLGVARGFRIEDRLSQEEIRQALSSAYPLERAVGAWAFLQRETRDVDRLGEEAVDALQLVFNEIAPDFLAIGAVDRASELSVALAAVSGPERLVIGALLPLSGPNRNVGQRSLAGMFVALRSFHVAGDPTVTLVIEDSHRGVEEGYRRLVAEGALAVVGPMQTSEARRLLEVVRELKVPILSLTAERVLEPQDHVEEIPAFRNFLNSRAEAQAIARLSFEVLGSRRAALVYPDMGYGRAMAEAFSEEFRALGGEIVADVSYDRQASDYVQTARAVARRNPDAIFLPDSAGKVSEVTAFLAQENIWGLAPDRRPPARAERTFVHYLGTSLWQDNAVLQQAASYVNGALVPAWYSPVFEETESRQFTSSYEAIYGRRADHFEAFAFDSVQALRGLLLDQNPSDGEAMTRALRRSSMVRGATGEYRFGSDGEPHRVLRFLTIHNGEWRVYDRTVKTPFSPEEQELSSDERGHQGL